MMDDEGEDFIWRTFYFGHCIKCKHFTGDILPAERVCEAFPGGIPREIWMDKIQHDKPYPGDRGIRFEERQG